MHSPQTGTLCTKQYNLVAFRHLHTTISHLLVDNSRLGFEDDDVKKRLDQYEGIKEKYDKIWENNAILRWE